MNNPICVALDTADETQARLWIKELSPHVGWFKIGKELFASVGSSIVKFAKNVGAKVFLDLKFHDIPNTVANASLACAQMGVDLINVHACGGLAMMAATKNILAQHQFKTQVIAVTVLTSLSQAEFNGELGLSGSIQNHVLKMATLTKQAGLDGVVLSGHEIETIRTTLGHDFLLVVPGLRLAASEQNDQTRVMTPEEAYKKGANILVIGRPITQSAEPGTVCQQILTSLTAQKSF